ncbi:PREDICTED: uncharacterized protein LOC106146980, partial [Chinchilla lanigera]|uniref:uncharacterized protein LOC106146980 n=1 Tax=Chinchilla lanigera TaxID=34839 RepID=UPI000697FC0C
ASPRPLRSLRPTLPSRPASAPPARFDRACQALSGAQAGSRVGAKAGLWSPLCAAADGARRPPERAKLREAAQWRRVESAGPGGGSRGTEHDGLREAAGKRDTHSLPAAQSPRLRSSVPDTGPALCTEIRASQPIPRPEPPAPLLRAGHQQLRSSVEKLWARDCRSSPVLFFLERSSLLPTAPPSSRLCFLGPGRHRHCYPRCEQRPESRTKKEGEANSASLLGDTLLSGPVGCKSPCQAMLTSLDSHVCHSQLSCETYQALPFLQQLGVASGNIRDSP